MRLAFYFNPHHYESGDPYQQESFIKHLISIHTTTRVVTFFDGSTSALGDYFNPHHYESGDICAMVFIKTFYNFNPHHYESGDKKKSGLSSRIKRFQSTPLREW